MKHTYVAAGGSLVLALGAATVAAFASVARSRADGPVKPLRQGAIAYYDDSCARCHGQDGSAYSPKLGDKYSLDQLRKKIDDMANGPGQSALDDEGLAAQVAYHQAIIAKTPFIDWTGLEGSTMTGEATRKSTVTAAIGDTSIPVVFTGIKWTLSLPSGTSAAAVTVTARLGDRQAVWSPKELPYAKPATWPPAPVQ